MTSCQDVVVIEARQVDKSRQKLLGSVLQNTDLCWQAFLSFPSPSPLAPFFHSFPFLARQNYRNLVLRSFSALKTHRNACYAGYYRFYSGPEGARVKVSPLFFLITRGRKAPESRFRLCFFLLLGAGRRPSQGFASVFSYYSGSEGARVKVAPLFLSLLLVVF